MSGKAFLDTNILIYLYSDKEPDKREAAYRILEQYDCISSLQIFNEASNVWFKKFGWYGDKITKHLDNIELVCDNVLTVERSTINKAIELKDLYKFSYYDSLMLASALEGKCSIIFTEDMNDGQVIEKVLKITNPFKNV
jgi:predicted nucleic acid-binding protein